MTDGPILQRKQGHNCPVGPDQVCAICANITCCFCGEAVDWSGDTVLVPFDEDGLLVHNDCGYMLAAEISGQQPAGGSSAP